MPRGIPKAKREPSLEPDPATISAAPLILLQPGVDGIQFTAYDMRLPEIVEALRLALLHTVAKSNGATVIDDHIARTNRVVTVREVPAKPYQPSVSASPSKLKAKPVMPVASGDGEHSPDW